MAKTTPSRAKSKTPAPKKALTPIEKRIISLEVRLSAGAKVRGLQDARITKLELYGTANVDSWIEQHDNRIKAIEGRLDKLASPTVAVEEKWVPKVNALAVYDGIVGMVDAHSANVGDWWSIHGRWVPTHKLSAPSPEEIAAHEAKVKAEAQAAEDAKLVFGARVKVEHSEAEWLYLRAMQNDPTAHLLAHDDGTAVVFRQFFTLLP